MAYIKSIWRSLPVLRWIFLGLLLQTASMGSASAKGKKGCGICNIGGPTTVTAPTTQTYQLSIACQGQATSWSVSCGTVQTSTSSYANIYFNNLTCSSAIITAYQNGSPLATLTVTI